MLDISFSELTLVFVIGLIVLGPQRLPVAVKNVVSWIQAIRLLAANIQHVLVQELKQQELQKLHDGLKKMEEVGCESLSPELKASMDELSKTSDFINRSIQQSIAVGKVKDEANTIHQMQPKKSQSNRLQKSHISALHQTSVSFQAVQSTDTMTVVADKNCTVNTPYSTVRTPSVKDEG